MRLPSPFGPANSMEQAEAVLAILGWGAHRPARADWGPPWCQWAPSRAAVDGGGQAHLN